MTTPAIVPTDTDGIFPWDWAPEWAVLATADESGVIWFYDSRCEPFVIEDADEEGLGRWDLDVVNPDTDCGHAAGLRLKPAHRSLDWRTTLRRRPQ